MGAFSAKTTSAACECLGLSRDILMERAFTFQNFIQEYHRGTFLTT